MNEMTPGGPICLSRVDWPRNAGLCIFLAVFAAIAHPSERESLTPPLPPTLVPGATPQKLLTEGRFFEGPSWDPASQSLYFTAFATDSTQIMRWPHGGSPAVWLDGSRGINGTWITREGQLLGAQAETRSIVAMKAGGSDPGEVQTVASHRRWMGPNDLCQAPNGDIYFTDPDFKDRKRSSVFLIKRDGQVHRVVSEMPAPNGVITSLDGSTLYVSDSHDLLWRAYPIRKDGTLGEGRVFFNPDVENKNAPDGMTIDEHGNLYFAGRGGVWAVSQRGEALGLIPIPEFCSNVTFGGPDHKTLYITCSGALYSIEMSVRSAK